MGYCKGVQITIIFGIHTAAETLKISFKTGIQSFILKFTIQSLLSR